MSVDTAHTNKQLVLYFEEYVPDYNYIDTRLYITYNHFSRNFEVFLTRRDKFVPEKTLCYKDHHIVLDNIKAVQTLLTNILCKESNINYTLYAFDKSDLRTKDFVGYELISRPGNELFGYDKEKINMNKYKQLLKMLLTSRVF